MSEKKIYVVVSETNDECSCGNRAFWSYDKAWAYAQEYDKATGCVMRLIHVEVEDEENVCG